MYPGGHVDYNDRNPLEAAKREVFEETGLKNFHQLKLTDLELVPIDIDTHIIGYNKRLNLPEHYHFDFRYLFVIDRTLKIKMDMEELKDYHWIDIDELSNEPHYSKAILKIERLLSDNKL